MVQHIFVWVIGVVVSLLIIHKVYKIFRDKGTNNKCSGCSGCNKKKECDK